MAKRRKSKKEEVVKGRDSGYGVTPSSNIPELTAPITEKEMLRLRFLLKMFNVYPAKFDNLLSALPAFELLDLRISASLMSTTRILPSIAEVEEMVEAFSPGPAALLTRMISWAHSMKLPYGWVVSSGIWVLRMMQWHEPSQTTEPSERLKVGFTHAIEVFGALPAVHTPESDVAELMLPKFVPSRQREDEYRAICGGLIDEHIARERQAHTDLGLKPVTCAPSEDEHLMWLAVRLIEKKSWRNIAQVTANGRVGHTAIADGVAKIANRIGVQLD